MPDTTLTIELSPEVYISLASLCAFYGKTYTELIEMAIIQLASDSMLITETIKAVLKITNMESLKKKEE